MDLWWQCLTCAVLAVCAGVEGIKNSFMEGSCGDTVSIGANALRLQLTSNLYYASTRGCTLYIESASYTKMSFYFESFDIVSNSQCTTAWLELHDGDSISSASIGGAKGYCGSTFIWPTGEDLTTGNYLTLKFVDNDHGAHGLGTGFDMIITPYHKGNCRSTEFQCGNGRCIDADDVCNGYNPCGDYSDCSHSLSIGAIVGSVIGSLVAIAIIVALVVFIRRCGN